MTHTTLRLLILLSGILLPWDWADAHLLILESSDQHSAYDQVPRFVREVYRRREDFLRAHPDGKVVLLINGDFSGLSEYAHDDGAFNYEMLGLLARDFELAVNVGNHEGFDWEVQYGNRLFWEQNRRLVEKVSQVQGKPFYLTTANLELGEHGQQIFRPYRDIPLGNSGKTVRFIGLVLREFFQRSDYAVGEAPFLFTGKVKDPVRTSVQQIELAQRAGVQAVVIASHDGHMNLKRDIQQIDLETQALPNRPHLSVAFAAHDHLQHLSQVNGTLIADAGHSYNLYSVILDDEGRVESSEFSAGSLPPIEPSKFRNEVERQVYQRAVALVAEASQKNQKVLGQIENPIPESRRTMQARRCLLGDALANSLVDWATGVLERKMPGHSYKIFAFYNSSSYRSEQNIYAGAITGGTIWRAYPFRSRPRIALIRGADLKKMFESLRRYRITSETNPARQYTPQLSTNLVELGTLDLHYRNGKGPEPLKLDETYALAMDGWLANNKYAVEDWEEIQSRIEWVEDTETTFQTDVLANHLPRRLEQIANMSPSCGKEVADSSNQ